MHLKCFLQNIGCLVQASVCGVWWGRILAQNQTTVLSLDCYQFGKSTTGHIDNIAISGSTHLCNVQVSNNLLTHCLLWDVIIIFKVQSPNKYEHFLWNYSQVNATEHMNIGSGNDLVLSGTKPLPEPMLTITVTIWRH